MMLVPRVRLVAAVGTMRRDQPLPAGDPGGRDPARRSNAIRGDDFRRRLDRQHGDTGADRPAARGQQIGVRNQHLRATISQDVGDLVGFQMPVDRHGMGAKELNGEARFDKSKFVPHQQRHPGVRNHAQPAQTRCPPANPIIKLRAGHHAIAALQTHGERCGKVRGLQLSAAQRRARHWIKSAAAFRSTASFPRSAEAIASSRATLLDASGS